jgi:hypothetical protein
MKASLNANIGRKKQLLPNGGSQKDLILHASRLLFIDIP